MNSSTTLEWPKADVDALFRAMELGRRYLNQDAGKALRAAAGALARAMGTSTRVAPKYRDITESPVNPGRKDLTAFDVTGWFGQPRKQLTKTVFSKSLANAKRRHAKIGRRGLAKKTWGVTSVRSAVENAGADYQVDQRTANVARKYVDVSSSYKGDDQFFKMVNSLPYIESALHGGPNAVNTAMSRAAASLTHSIERQLVKRMGFGALSR